MKMSNMRVLGRIFSSFFAYLDGLFSFLGIFLLVSIGCIKDINAIELCHCKFNNNQLNFGIMDSKAKEDQTIG